jgi:uncharacterized protein YdaU (DUF1376 family)
MNDNYWYPRDPQRFLTDTAWCDIATEVAHNRLTDTYYALGRPIKDDAERIKLIGKIKDADYNRVRGNLQELGWRFEGGELRHRRIEETMADMDAERAAKIAASAAGVEKRRQLGQLPAVKPTVQRVVQPPKPENVADGLKPPGVPSAQKGGNADLLGKSQKGEPAVEPTVNLTTTTTTTNNTNTESVMEELVKRLGELYRRPAGARWTYNEESTLAEICRRDDAIAEFDHILALRRSMQPDDRKRFFPQSINSLLQKWNETLDKARIQCPIKRTQPAKAAPKRAGNDHQSAAMIREGLEYLRQNNPTSPLIATQEKLLKEVEG